MERFEAIVVGVGHAGSEAALALARQGIKTLALSISLDNAGFLACNPSIGGTAKGHIVCEIDALGGEMGKAADSTLTQLRMLNSSKGAAVQSLRAQVDKFKYHSYIKAKLENQENLSLKQTEVKKVLVENGRVVGVCTTSGSEYRAKSVLICTGVYLESSVIIGDLIEQKGPSGFSRSNHLAQSLRELGFNLRRFKTGTPARVKKSSVGLEKLSLQEGMDTPYSFSTSSNQSKLNKKKSVCFLGHTNLYTHEIIKKNLSKSPKYGGVIFGAGARYCPSIEDKIVRFTDKERHSFFLEPEGQDTEECYVQGLSTSLPVDIQQALYSSIEGFENVEIMRDAYAIEYECIDPLSLYPTLESKEIKGLYFAGQINGTSGYEEAAAQGLVAGINSAKQILGQDRIVIPRETSYIGVLIDDLTTKGTDEPYRMMTSRAEFRLILRQDNADIRLFEIAKAAGLFSKASEARVTKKIKGIEKGKKLLADRPSFEKTKHFLQSIQEPPPQKGMSYFEIIKRSAVTIENFLEAFSELKKITPEAFFDIFTETKYLGYVARERQAAVEKAKIGDKKIPPEIDYRKLGGLRLEAVEKLEKIRPLTIGQASRIPGINPADITVLIIKLRN